MAAVSILTKSLVKLVFAMAIWCFAGAMLVSYGPEHFTTMRGAASSTILARRQATYTTAKDVASVQTSGEKLSPSSDSSSRPRSPDASSEPSVPITSLVFGGLAAIMFLSVTTTTYSMLHKVDARLRSVVPAVSHAAKYVAPVKVAPAAPTTRKGKIVPAMVSTGDQVRLTSPEGAQSDWVFNEGSAFKALAEQLGTH